MMPKRENATGCHRGMQCDDANDEDESKCNFGQFGCEYERIVRLYYSFIYALLVGYVGDKLTGIFAGCTDVVAFTYSNVVIGLSKTDCS